MLTYKQTESSNHSLLLVEVRSYPVILKFKLWNGFEIYTFHYCRYGYDSLWCNNVLAYDERRFSVRGQFTTLNEAIVKIKSLFLWIKKFKNFSVF